MQSCTWKKTCSTWVQEDDKLEDTSPPTRVTRAGEAKQQGRTGDQLKLHSYPWPVSSTNHQLTLELEGIGECPRDI